MHRARLYRLSANDIATGVQRDLRKARFLCIERLSSSRQVLRLGTPQCDFLNRSKPAVVMRRHCIVSEFNIQYSMTTKGAQAFKYSIFMVGGLSRGAIVQPKAHALGASSFKSKTADNDTNAKNKTGAKISRLYLRGFHQIPTSSQG